MVYLFPQSAAVAQWQSGSLVMNRSRVVDKEALYMDGSTMVIFVLAGAVVGGLYGLFLVLRNKSAQKKQQEDDPSEKKEGE